ncbi:NFX1-type zinc finger-containing protein 1-like [Watersipora subatra]|uniref:NFX1-type zinc finger-containing protein 1-like n=1 Tax=Watersipora subatra TaxID=2589382 RepID=UPI00355C75F0
MKELQGEYQNIVSLADNLRNARVIGMTTTGAARLQTVLQEVGPRIVVVEEAAEVLEAHIVTALSKHCQHLILIGDHKQLKPNPTVYDLAVKYHLDLSLFERMVNNGLPVNTLNIQHRMRPEISKYIRGHVYDSLDDHPSVLERAAVKGMKSPVFFFNHDNPEKSDESTGSKSNAFEAQLVVELARYLLQQENYKPEHITIITMYTGQLLLIKRYMPRKEFQGMKITSVDNFQGEENKVVIISLVRSNEEGNLGFVKIENRVCVALSRAQYGMYVFGNFDMLCTGSTLWQDIVTQATDANEIGSSLVICCEMHKNQAKVSKPGDFKIKAPAGGCQLKCDTKLDCGHTCKSSCHSRDPNHLKYKCTESCSKLLNPCGHPCTAMCHQKCPECCKMVSKVLVCGHTREVACHMISKQSVLQCIAPCSKTLPDCGHKCAEKCSADCTRICKVQVERACSRCNELKKMRCYEAKEMATSLSSQSSKYSFQCETPCNSELPCGHKCRGVCYQWGAPVVADNDECCLLRPVASLIGVVAHRHKKPVALHLRKHQGGGKYLMSIWCLE